MPLTISWKEEGRTEGRVNEAQRMLLLFGARRLGAPSPVMLDWLNRIDSPERLESLAERMADVETWDELRALLP